jgi:rhodanese-related sulfurtransferase
MDHHDEEFLKQAAEARARIRETSAAEVEAQHQAGALVLDVREEHEHAAGHVAGAVNLNLNVLAENIAGILPDKDATVICYCNGGNRGAIGADTLQDLGYKNVFSIEGGFRGYQAAGGKVGKK